MPGLWHIGRDSGIVPCMPPLADQPLVRPTDRAAWRAWLEAHHTVATGIWVALRRRPSPHSEGLAYEAAVEEALCFGWVDATAGRLDDEHTKLYFAPRKARSPWAATNKARVERLIAAGRMAPAGLAAIEWARANGSWSVLDGAERLEVPEDLAAALAARAPAAVHFAAFPPSARKQLIGWVALARTPGTRAARIVAIAEAAARNERARA